MKQTKDSCFADSNILLYLLSNDEQKKDVAKIILKANPIISTQVLSENINVLIKKFPQLKFTQIEDHIRMLAEYCTVLPVNLETINKAIELRSKYHFQWYDCTILAAANLNECTIVYSEDMQHNQLISGDIKIINPFL